MHAIQRPSIAMAARALVAVVVAGSAVALPFAGPVAAAERSAGCEAVNAFGTQTAENSDGSWIVSGTTFTAGEVTTAVFQSDGTDWSGELTIADAGGSFNNPQYLTPSGVATATLTHTYDGTETGTGVVLTLIQGTATVTITCVAAANPTPAPTPTATAAPTAKPKISPPDSDTAADGGGSSSSDAPLLLLTGMISVGVLLSSRANRARSAR